MTLRMNLGQNSYDITVERGVLKNAAKYLSLDRKVLIVTDDGVPADYAKTVAANCKEAHIVTIAQGENSKCFAVLQQLLQTMLENGFSRSDTVVAVGGGVVGDLAGFAASIYMRGIDFYNVPTTLLSMVDSSIGGKTAIDFNNIKNCVGSFHQPTAVLIDPNVLSSLPERQIANGLAEVVKMAATFDKYLFALLEESDILENIDTIIVRSLAIKKHVVEQDEKEAGLRRVLNFGHTIGHGIESCSMEKLYHGECVALGMLPLAGDDAKKRIVALLIKIGLPTVLNVDIDAVCMAILHDKKRDGDSLRIIFVPEIGKYEIKTVAIDTFETTVKEAFAK